MRNLFIISLFLMLSLDLSGQEQIYSQSLEVGSFLNPSLIGNTENDARVGGIYRSQWNVEESPYQNYGLFYEAKHKSFKYGLLINHSKTGDIGFRKTSILLSTGLSKKLGRGNNKISFGLQAGIYQMNFNTVSLQFDNQYLPGVGFDSSLASGEEFEATTLIKPDINIGLSADLQFHGNLKIDGQIGFSVAHIKTPGRTFNKEDIYLPMMTVFHAKAFIHLNQNWGVEPVLIYAMRELDSESRAGLNIGFNLMDNRALKIGAAHDLDGVATFLSKFEMEKFSVGLSIDVNLTKTHQTLIGNNTLELTMIYNIQKKGNKTHHRDVLR